MRLGSLEGLGRKWAVRDFGLICALGNIRRQEMLENHLGIKCASKLKDLSKKGLYDVTHVEEKWKREERERKMRKKRF